MLTSLKATNFKALRGCEIEFANITVLAGSNSVGKSSTIQALLLIRSIIDNVRSRNALSVSGEIKIPLNGPYMLSLGSTREVISWESGKDFSLEFSKEKARFDFVTKNLDERNFSISVRFPALDPIELNFVRNKFYYLNAERLGPRIRHWVNENTDIMHCGHRGEFTLDVLARLADDTDFIIPQEKFLNGKRIEGQQSINRYTQQWIDFVIPGTVIDVPEILGNLRSASVKFNSFFTAPNVGFGVSYCLPILVTGLLAAKGSTILIENPEAHLHPKAQSNLGFFLACMAKAGIQIILETHSEHIVSGIRIGVLEKFDAPSEKDLVINFFKRGQEGIEITKISMDSNGDLTDFPIDFFDQVQQDISTIHAKSKNKNGQPSNSSGGV